MQDYLKMQDYLIVYTDNTTGERKMFPFQVKSVIQESEIPIRTILPKKLEKNNVNLCSKFAQRLRGVVV